MEYLLIAVLWWKEPALSFARFATEGDCVAAGKIIVALAEGSRTRGRYECLQVTPLRSSPDSEKVRHK